MVLYKQSDCYFLGFCHCWNNFNWYGLVRKYINYWDSRTLHWISHILFSRKYCCSQITSSHNIPFEYFTAYPLLPNYHTLLIVRWGCFTNTESHVHVLTYLKRKNLHRAKTEKTWNIKENGNKVSFQEHWKATSTRCVFT